MEALELCIVIAYLLVPLFSAFVVRRFSHHLLDRLREELYWFSLLTFLAGVRHLGTVTGWLHDEAFLKVALAVAIWVSAVGILRVKLLLAIQFESLDAKSEKEKRDKQMFMAIIFHELRNPMQSIVSMVDFLNQTHPTEEQTVYIRAIGDAARLMKRLADDVLDISKMEAGQLKIEHVAFDLRKCIRAALQGFVEVAQRLSLQLDVSFDEALPTSVVSDPTRLQQIICNLVSNAMKFTKKGGVSVIATTNKEEMIPQLVLQVKDTGIGMSPSDVEKLFIPFCQAKLSTFRVHGGTGLGLVVCRHLLKLMGGRITVISLPSSGTTFTVHLPLHESVVPQQVQLNSGKPVAKASISTAPPQLLPPIVPLALPPQHHPTIAPPASSKCEETTTMHAPVPTTAKQTILVVDDNEVICKLLARMISELGYNVETASNGVEALKRFSTSSRGKFALILMDLTMPVMDGYTAARRLRDDYRYEGPIIALTAKSELEEAIRVRAFGMTDIVWKPISRTQLRELFEKYIAKEACSEKSIAKEACRTHPGG
jgi:signal transduction histidine kinase/FixJ family two-component response regulator